MKKLALALTASAALALSACGGDSEPTETEEPALTQEEFVTQANAICKAGEKRLTAAGEALGDNPTPADVEALIKEKALPETRKVVEQIDELEAPEELEADVDAMLEAMETDLDKVEADWQVFVSDDIFAEANKKANELGLTDCSD